MKHVLFFLLASASLASAQTRTVTVDGNGTIVSPDATTFRLGLGLGGAATLNVGTTAGTVAAGNDSRIVAGGTALQPGPYAVIWIPLPPGSQWTDFELKASRDNFTNDTTNLVFFYHSPDPTKITHGKWTTRPDVYFTDSGRTGTPNQRMWRKQTTTSIFAALTDANSEVGGFLVVVKDDLSADRSSLVWSYSILDGTTHQSDPAARSVWRPVWPVEWVSEFTPNP